MTRHITDIFDRSFDRRPLAVRPYLIAEAGVNHEGSLDVARRMIDEAASAGADAVKFQTYKAASLAVRDSPAYWDLGKESTTTQYELFERHDSFGAPEYEALKEHCDARGVDFMSTPFDTASAYLIDDLVDVHKVSSSDLTNRPLIELLASFGKPILLSTGASDLTEMRRAVGWIEAAGAPLALLHCVLNYPTAEADAALGRIVALREAFAHLPIGYSDHTVPADLEALVVAAGLGAVVIETHFTHDRTLPGNDHYHALDAGLFQALVQRLDRAVMLAGRFDLDFVAAESISRQHARRSLVTTSFLPAGMRIEPHHLTWKRPGGGISPADIDDVIGRTTVQDVEVDTALQWDDLV